MSDGVESYRRDAADRWTHCQKTIAFGDGDYVFRLPLKMITELENKCDCGIGELYLRMASHGYKAHEVVEIIRCALIGGGLDPDKARVLIETYIEGYALDKMHNLASVIMVGCVEGYPAKSPKKKRKRRRKRKRDRTGSTTPQLSKPDQLWDSLQETSETSPSTSTDA